MAASFTNFIMISSQMQPGRIFRSDLNGLPAAVFAAMTAADGKLFVQFFKSVNLFYNIG
jgi:hypothetical protein